MPSGNKGGAAECTSDGLLNLADTLKQSADLPVNLVSLANDQHL